MFPKHHKDRSLDFTESAFWLKASKASAKGIPRKSPRSLKIPFH